MTSEVVAHEFESARTVVYPWQCDTMGHFATQHYMKVFDDATYHLMGRLGYALHEAPRTRRGWADVSHAIEYRHELIGGDLLVAFSGILRLGRTSFTYRTRLARASAPGLDCATLTGVAVHFDLDRREAIELPAEFRAIATTLLAPA